MCSSSIVANLTRPTLLHCLIFAAGSSCGRDSTLMVGTPEHRHNLRHRHTAAILALRAIAAVSPVRERDRRAERRRIIGDHRRRAIAVLLRGMREVLGLPIQRRNCRPPQPPRVDLEATIDLLSNTSVDDQVLKDPEPQPPVVNLDSSLESLPDIDPRPQHQLPVPSLPGDLLPPLQHRVLREAYALLERLQLPPFQPLTPPPELQPHPVSPLPMLHIDWGVLEGNLAIFDGPPVPLLLQPCVVPIPQFVPVQFSQPPPLLQVDWAAIAHA